MKGGGFIVSLDFELYWGVRDHRGIDAYGQQLKGVHKAVPTLLKLFKQYQIHCTWATVGLLFCKSQAEMLDAAPPQLPSFINPNYSPYPELKTENRFPETDPYRLDLGLLDLIQETENQEIGSHTYSHLYCLEKGPTVEEFKVDLLAAQAIAKRKNISLKSLVFPRNQFSRVHLKAAAELGFKAYRGTEKSILYQPKSREEENLLRRAARLIDAYVPIQSQKGMQPELEIYDSSNKIVNVPSTRFLRPFSKKLKALDSFRLNRIKSEMTHCAKHNLFYHLWWHPHNFGLQLEENMAFLIKIAEHFSQLKREYNMTAFTMDEAANSTINKIN